MKVYVPKLNIAGEVIVQGASNELISVSLCDHFECNKKCENCIIDFLSGNVKITLKGDE